MFHLHSHITDDIVGQRRF